MGSGLAEEKRRGDERCKITLLYDCIWIALPLSYRLSPR